MRVESSIITSLSELRAIEQQRIADERAALERERRAEIDAREAAERVRREAEEARARAERDEIMRIEQARLDAERDARLRVEAAEAAERQRHLAALEEQRLAQEMELRRAEIAKKRPAWMLVVTGLALAAAIGLGWYAIERNAERDEADRARVAALEDKRAAQRKAEEARQELDRLAKQLDALDAQVVQAQRTLLAAQTKADRERAAAELRQANLQRVEIQRAKDETIRKRLEEERKTILNVDDCLHNSLDCIDGVKKKKGKR